MIPTNLLGLSDNYHPENPHGVPALIRQFNEVKVNNLFKVVIWGTSNPKREFFYVDDMAAASNRVMNLSNPTTDHHTEPAITHINVGCGKYVNIIELAPEMCVEIVMYYFARTMQHALLKANGYKPMFSWNK